MDLEDNSEWGACGILLIAINTNYDLRH